MGNCNIMIFSVLITVSSWVLRIVASALSALEYAIPTYLQDGLEQFVAYLQNVGGILPIYADSTMSGLVAAHGIIDIFLFILIFMSHLFGFFILKKLFAVIPFIGVKL